MRHALRLVCTAALVTALAACGSGAPATGAAGEAPPASDTVAPSDGEATPVPAPTEDASEPSAPGGAAFVESLDVMLLESFPLQVRVAVAGQLSDPCTELAEPRVRRDGNSFHVELPTVRREGMCAQVLVPFETTVPLDVHGLPKGTYQVVAGDRTATFTFERDNVLRRDGSG